MSDRPVFVFAIHRSGGTLLVRMLNCHPGLVIWGEHAGFINKLADADLIVRSCRDALGDYSEDKTQNYIDFDDDCLREFSPWICPFGTDDFGDRCRDLIQAMYSRGYRAGQRWGFKEIRYHRPHVAAFLERLFPEGQFILLIRDPVELCVSNLLTEWSLERLLACGGGHDRVEFLRIVEDCLYAILAIQQNFSRIQMLFPEKCRSIRYEELVLALDKEMNGLFNFLNLPLAGGVLGRIETVAGSIAGATDKTWNRDRGFLNEAEIRAACGNVLADIAEDIRVNGIDVGRLLGRDGQGKYSFIVGELLLNEPLISAMF